MLRSQTRGMFPDEVRVVMLKRRILTFGSRRYSSTQTQEFSVLTLLPLPRQGTFLEFVSGTASFPPALAFPFVAGDAVVASTVVLIALAVLSRACEMDVVGAGRFATWVSVIAA